MFQHVGRICIDAKGASLFQFGLAVATGEKAHRERSPATRRQHIPNVVANDNAVVQRNSQPLSRGDEYIGRRFGLGNSIAGDDCCLSRDSQGP